MLVELIDNRVRSLATVLIDGIKQCRDIRIAVAFVSRRGLDVIRPSVDAALQSGAKVEFLVGLDMHTTEDDALHDLYYLSSRNSTVAFDCYVSLKAGTVYHPKLYLLRSYDDTATAIVGSSNLTQGGLRANVEVNVALTGELSEDAISDAYSTYSQLKLLPGRVAPDEELLELYGQARKAIMKQAQQGSNRALLNDLLNKFQEKARTLRKPTITSEDLVGWPKLVYDMLPDGEFSNNDVYARSHVFEQRYPQNRNVKAKVRQQLQILRDFGLIEHMEHGHWKKRR